MNLAFRRYDAEAARAARATVERVFRGGYAAAIESGVAFDTPEAFMRRFDAYAGNPALDLVIAYRAYVRWGWQAVAKLRPGWPDAPTFDVLILPLPLAVQ